MLTRYKNLLLESVEKSGFHPSLFTTNENGGEYIVEFRDSPLRFIIEQSEFSFDVFRYRSTIFAPDFPLSKWATCKGRHIEGECYFDEVAEGFEEWLNTIRRYVSERDIPDLWSQLQTYKTYFETSNISLEDHKPFSESEKAQIRASINEFRRLLVANLNPPEEQMQSITEKLDYLSEAVERLARFDWRGLAISVVAGIAVNLTVDTQGGRLIFGLFQQAFHSLIKMLP